MLLKKTNGWYMDRMVRFILAFVWEKFTCFYYHVTSTTYVRHCDVFCDVNGTLVLVPWVNVLRSTCLSLFTKSPWKGSWMVNIHHDPPKNTQVLGGSHLTTHPPQPSIREGKLEDRVTFPPPTKHAPHASARFRLALLHSSPTHPHKEGRTREGCRNERTTKNDSSSSSRSNNNKRDPHTLTYHIHLSKNTREGDATRSTTTTTNNNKNNNK